MDTLKVPNHTQFPNIIIDNYMCHLTGGQIKIILAIARKTIGWHKKTDQISNTQMAKLTGLTIPGIKKAMNTLIECGIIKMNRSGTGKGIKTNYELCYNGKLSNIQLSLPLAPINGKLSLPKKPSNGKLSLPTKERKEILKKEKVTLFNAFYKEYPKHRAKDKALKSWMKIKLDKELIETIMEAVNRQKETEDWIKDNGKYVPYPATWLNQKRWEDEIEKEKDAYDNF